GEPVKARQHGAVFLAGIQSREAIGVSEIRETLIGEQRRVAEDLVEDVRLLQVIHFLARADEGRGRELLVRQQAEELAEGNQRRHGRASPAGRLAQRRRDFLALRDAVAREVHALQRFQVLVAGVFLDNRQLARDQLIPYGVLFFRVVDEAVLVRLLGDVLGSFAHDRNTSVGRYCTAASAPVAAGESCGFLRRTPENLR